MRERRRYEREGGDREGGREGGRVGGGAHLSSTHCRSRKRPPLPAHCCLLLRGLPAPLPLSPPPPGEGVGEGGGWEWALAVGSQSSAGWVGEVKRTSPDGHAALPRAAGGAEGAGRVEQGGERGEVEGSGEN